MISLTIVISQLLSPISSDNYMNYNKEQATVLCKRSPECSKLAEMIVYEARGESDKGQTAVAHVVLNRAKHPKHWSDNIIGVVHQPHQFSYIKDKHTQSKPKAEDWDKAYKIAYKAINGYSTSPVGDATFYHRTSITPPKHLRNKEYVTTIGNHIFYRMKNNML